MKIIFGCDLDGLALKNELIEFLKSYQLDILDVSPDGDKDFFDASIKVVKEVLKDDQSRGIIIDKIGSGPFMVAAKHKHIICAQANDEHSAKMTRDHNNANVIAMGSGIIGSEVAKSIALRFVTSEYSGGRHQIRVDMLDKMC